MKVIPKAILSYMFSIKFLLLFLSPLLVFCYGCKKNGLQSKSDLSVRSFKIDEAISNPSTKLKLSTIYDTLYYIPLETTDESLINRISDLKCEDDLIFILDKGKRVLLFNDKGKFIRQIGVKGNAPTEYENPLYLEIDKTKDHVIIYDDRGRKVLIYNYNSELINTIKLNESYYHYYIPFRGNDILAYVAKPFSKYNDGFNIGIFNKAGEISATMLKRNEKGNKNAVTAVAYNKLYNYRDTVSLWEFHYDTIYRILPNLKMEPIYSFDMGKYKMPMKFRNSKSFLHELKYPYISNVLEAKTHFFLETTTLNGNKKLIVKKENGIVKNLGKFGFVNDLNNSLPFWPSFNIEPKVHAMSIQPFELLNDIKNNKAKINLSFKEHKLLKNSNLIDNPWIVVAKLNK